MIYGNYSSPLWQMLYGSDRDFWYSGDTEGMGPPSPWQHAFKGYGQDDKDSKAKRNPYATYGQAFAMSQSQPPALQDPMSQIRAMMGMMGAGGQRPYTQEVAPQFPMNSAVAQLLRRALEG